MRSFPASICTSLLLLAAGCGGASMPTMGTGVDHGVSDAGQSFADASSPTDAAVSPVGTKTLQGNFVIKSSLDVDALADVGTITGTLTLQPGTGLDDIFLPAIAHVGDLVVTFQPKSLRCPALVTIDKSFFITPNNTATTLATIDFHALKTVGTLSFNYTALTDLHFEALETAGAMSVQSINSLVSITMPALKQAASIDIRHNPALTTLSMDALASIDSYVSVNDNNSLAACRVQQVFAALTANLDNTANNGTTPCN